MCSARARVHTGQSRCAHVCMYPGARRLHKPSPSPQIAYPPGVAQPGTMTLSLLHAAPPPPLQLPEFKAHAGTEGSHPLSTQTPCACAGACIHGKLIALDWTAGGRAGALIPPDRRGGMTRQCRRVGSRTWMSGSPMRAENRSVRNEGACIEPAFIRARPASNARPLQKGYLRSFPFYTAPRTLGLVPAFLPLGRAHIFGWHRRWWARRTAPLGPRILPEQDTGELHDHIW